MKLAKSKGTRLRFYPAVIVILGAGLLVLLLSRLEITVQRESPAPSQADPTETESPVAVNPALERSPTPPTPTVSPTVSPTPTPITPTEGQAERQAEGQAPATPLTAGNLGKLRVSNPTDHPVRVALLAQKSEAAENSASVNSGAELDLTFVEPVHWDFAPGEGRTRGLILSLPDQDLQLQDGDVLVAFAQDGSRRYWGPYVVGQTASPQWNSETTEWQLVIQP